MSEEHRAAIVRLAEEVMARGNWGLLPEVYVPRMVPVARRWMEPFRESFPDVQMRLLQLVSEEDTAAARFRCSGTHLGPWLGHGDWAGGVSRAGAAAAWPAW